MSPARPLREIRGFFDRAAPRWATRDFDRDLMERLVDRVGLAPNDRVLDLGGGTGHLLPALRQRVGPGGRLCVVDEAGPFGSPTADSARTCIEGAVEAALVIFYQPADGDRTRLDAALDHAIELAEEHLAAKIAERHVIES